MKQVEIWINITFSKVTAIVLLSSITQQHSSTLTLLHNSESIMGGCPLRPIFKCYKRKKNIFSPTDISQMLYITIADIIVNKEKSYCIIQPISVWKFSNAI